MVYEKEAAVIFAAYVIGSFSPAHLLGKFKHVDVRKKGKFRNYGASNIRSLFGWKLGFFVAAADVLKGIAAAYLAVYLGLQPVFAYACAALVVVGHRFPFYLGFKGGKGVAAGSGAFLLLMLVFGTLESLAVGLVFYGYAVATSPRLRKRKAAVAGILAAIFLAYFLRAAIFLRTAI